MLKHLPFLVIAFTLQATASAQYTVTTGTRSFARLDEVVDTLSGPYSGYYTKTLPCYAKCEQLQGTSSELVPWTTPYQTLYDNQWTVTPGVYLYVALGVSGYIKGELTEESNIETGVRNSDNAVFKRKYSWSEYSETSLSFETA